MQKKWWRNLLDGRIGGWLTAAAPNKMKTSTGDPHTRDKHGCRYPDMYLSILRFYDTTAANRCVSWWYLNLVVS
jgi:hypothetical protein